MKTIEWDLTPSWWSKRWWLEHHPSTAVTIRDECRDPRAVAYAIECVVRWVHPGATLVVSDAQLLARFEIEDEEMYLAQRRDEAAAGTLIMTPEEARDTSPKTMEEARKHAHKFIEALVRPYVDAEEKKRAVVKPNFPHINFMLWGRHGPFPQFQLEVNGVRGVHALTVVSQQGGSDAEALASMFDAAALVLRAEVQKEKP